MVSELIFLSEVVCDFAFEPVGWQAGPSCQSCKSSADVN